MSSRKLSFNGLASTISSFPLPLRPKKKLYFDVTFTLQELVNCTLITGVLFAKIQLKDGGDFSGTSHRSDVDNHRVTWDQDFNFTCKMFVNATTGVLEPCWCKISLRKESKGGRSYSKLGFIRINLAEYAGAGVKHRRYLLESYNENKQKPDNSLLKVKVYLRQTAGDIVYKAPEAKTFDIVGEEDEGFQEDWLSFTKDHRASTGSTMSSYSISTNTWSNHSGSAGNLKSSTGDVSREKEEPTLSELTIEREGHDRESGSEETVVERCPSHVTNESATTTPTSQPRSINNNPIKLPQSGLTTPPIVNTTLPPILNAVPPTPVTTNVTHFEDLPEHASSLRDLRHSPNLRKNNSSLLPPPGLSSAHLRRSKVSPSISASRVTASLGGSASLHRRQASMGGATPTTPSPLVGSHHKRHSSVSALSHREDLADVTSLSSAKTRVTVLSTLEQSRVDTESLVNKLIATHDLTPASDDEGKNNLKLYFDKHSGRVTVAGDCHSLDKSRFREIEVNDESCEPAPRPAPRRKNRHRSSTSSTLSSSSAPPPKQTSSSSSNTSTP